MNRSALFVLTLIVAALPAGPVSADGMVIDKIYHPYVQPLEREFEWRAALQDYQPDRPDHLQMYRLAYGMSLGEKWFAEAYVVGGKSDEDSFE